MEGYGFTWSKSKGKHNAIEEKLDRAMTSFDWLNMLPNVKLRNLIAFKLNHSPIHLLLDANCKKPFYRKIRFKTTWLLEPFFPSIIKEGWENALTDNLISKLERFSSYMNS